MPYVIAFGSDSRHGVVLGKSEKCNKYNISLDEPLSQALLKCADLVVEEADFNLLRRKSKPFYDLCAGFGTVHRLFFDECIVEVEGSTSSDKLMQVMTDNFGTPCTVNAADSFVRYSVTASGENALAALSGKTCAMMRYSGDEAVAITLVAGSDDGESEFTRTLAVPTDDANIILMLLQSIVDFADVNNAAYYTLVITDYRKKQAEKSNQKKNLTVRQKFRAMSDSDHMRYQKKIAATVKDNNLDDLNSLYLFIHDNPLELELCDLCAVAERVNNKRLGLGEYFASRDYMRVAVAELPDFPDESISFCINGLVPFSLLFAVVERFKDRTKDFSFVGFDVKSRLIVSLLKQHSAFNNYTFNYADNALDKRFDLCITNEYKPEIKSDYTLLLCEKRLFNEPEYADIRDDITEKRVYSIIDLEKYGISGKHYQHAVLLIDNNSAPENTKVLSNAGNNVIVQRQSYIFGSDLPYWIIYRNADFDEYYNALQFDAFDIFCDHQIKHRDVHQSGDLRILKLRDLTKDGEIDSLADSGYLNAVEVPDYEVLRYADGDNLYIVPRTSECIRIAKKPQGTVTNGSMAVLIPKGKFSLSSDELKMYSSKQFRAFYNIANNAQPVSLAYDYGALYFLGVQKNI